MARLIHCLGWAITEEYVLFCLSEMFLESLFMNSVALCPNLPLIVVTKGVKCHLRSICVGVGVGVCVCWR